ncbi:MAG: hypothetical protein KF828_06980 [Anaerolineales bacterium]|nr:hypothetical protein [Anaerolineales bacterium]
MKDNKVFRPWIFLLVLAALAYLDNAWRMGYFSDDWYLLFSGITYGPAKFWDVYIIDRPLRGVLQYVLFSLFGSTVWLYYLAALIMRIAGALGFYWMLRLLLREQRLFTVLAAALFLVYPGFLEQPNAMDFMAQQVAMTAIIFSICFSIRFVLAPRWLVRAGYLLLSVGLALVGYMLMEYYIGMEAYRFLFLLYLMRKRGRLLSKRSIGLLAPLLVAPAAFTIWRLFIFQGARANTNLAFVQSHLGSGLWLELAQLAGQFVVDVSETFLGAFVLPFSLLFGRLGELEIATGLLLGALAAGATVLVMRPALAAHKAELTASKQGALFLALAFLAGVFCLALIAVSGRDLSFLFYNRFSFPSAMAVAIVLAFIGLSFRSRYVQMAFFALLLFISVATHYANGVRFAQEWEDTQRFWQQLTWRIPNLEDGTMLTGRRVAPIYEDYYLWSPLNLLYRPFQGQIVLSAEVLNSETVQNISAGVPFEKNRRSLYLVYDFSKTLVFSQPTRQACLRVLNADQIELSTQDDPLVALAAPYSMIGQVQAEGAADERMFARLFGPAQATQDWCYVYQKADLARQQGDWAAVAAYGQQAAAAELAPADAIEWMPFVQAYAYQGELAQAAELAERIGTTPYYAWQACEIFSAKPLSGDAAIDAGNQQLAAWFCAAE